MACCSPRTAAILLLLTAVPLALLATLELSPTPASYRYRSHGWMRECAKWDAPRRRFLASTFFDGGVAEIKVDAADSAGLEERTIISDPDVKGNTSMGIAIDGERGRVLAVYADAVGQRYGAVGAYDLLTGERRFLVQLSGPDDGMSMADDVAVDSEGNAYITDCKANIIWKLGLKGELLSVIRSQTFVPRKEWYYNFLGLNGIAYHPSGYLLVIHTSTGYLFKIDIAKEEVSIIKVKGSLLMGDGLELLSPSRLVIAGSLSTRLVESSDDWQTATVKGTYAGPLHRAATSATVKDGKAYINYIFGGGLPKRTHLITEAVFSPVSAK